MKYDIPSCCPLGALEAEAKKRGLNPEDLLKELNRLIRKKH